MIKTTKKLKNTVKTEAGKTPATNIPATPAPAKPVAAKPVALEPVAVVKPAPTPTPIVTPPKPIVKNLVSLELVKPEAKSVSVAGSFNEWKPEKTPLVSLGNGRWKGDLNVKPGRHEYLFVVDGQWVPDPNAKESVANPFGGTNSVLIVSE